LKRPSYLDDVVDDWKKKLHLGPLDNLGTQNGDEFVTMMAIDNSLLETEDRRKIKLEERKTETELQDVDWTDRFSKNSK
jgi:hypothetical protein